MSAHVSDYKKEMNKNGPLRIMIFGFIELMKWVLKLQLLISRVKKKTNQKREHKSLIFPLCNMHTLTFFTSFGGKKSDRKQNKSRFFYLLKSDSY